MSDIHITYLVGAGCAVIGLIAFALLLVAPAVSSYRHPGEKAAAVLLSLYVLLALIGIGIFVGYEVFTEWPRIF